MQQLSNYLDKKSIDSAHDCARIRSDSANMVWVLQQASEVGHVDAERLPRVQRAPESLDESPPQPASLRLTHPVWQHREGGFQVAGRRGFSPA
jgi:hypothetical protein